MLVVLIAIAGGRLRRARLMGRVDSEGGSEGRRRFANFAEAVWPLEGLRCTVVRGGAEDLAGRVGLTWSEDLKAKDMTERWSEAIVSASASRRRAGDGPSLRGTRRGVGRGDIGMREDVEVVGLFRGVPGNAACVDFAGAKGEERGTEARVESEATRARMLCGQLTTAQMSRDVLLHRQSGTSAYGEWGVASSQGFAIRTFRLQMPFKHLHKPLISFPHSRFVD